MSVIDRTPLHPAEIRRVLESVGVSPFKGWGQHFLTEPDVPRQMVDAAGVGPGDLVVEIGPGLGVLTAPLLASGATVIAIEIDPRLLVYLRERFGGQERLTLIEGDILRLSPGQLVAGRPYSVIANLPYSITSAALRHLIEPSDRPTQLMVMLQAEVAERIVAVPPDMSLLAVSVQLFGKARLVVRVPATSFTPPPRVDSAVVDVVTREPGLDAIEQKRFFRIVGAGFRQRRKTLGNALSAGLALPVASIVPVLHAANIDPRRRAETLSVDDWLRLNQTLRESLAPGGERT